MRIKHKALFFLSCVFLVLMVITGIMQTKTNNRLESSKARYQQLKENIKNADKTIYNSTDLTELEKELENLKIEYSLLCDNDKQAVDTAEKYILTRYQFSGTPNDNKDRILTELDDILTSDFKESLEKELSQTSAGNGFVSQDFMHTCKIENIYIANGYEVGPSNDYNAVEKYEPVYNKDVYAKIIVNGNCTAICNVTLTKDSRENKNWKIYYEYLPAAHFTEEEAD